MSNYYVAGIPFNGDNALCHFGILGMKWGVRRYQNRDGTLTAEGRARYGSKGEQKKLAQALTKGSTRSLTAQSVNHAKIASSPQVKIAVQEVKNYTEDRLKAEKDYDQIIDRDFFRNKEVHDEYVNKAVDAYIDRYGADMAWDIDYYHLPAKFRQMSRRDFVKWMYEHEDWDQGDCGSWEMFMESKDPRAAEAQRANKRLTEAESKEREAIRSLTNEFLGEYADTRVRTMYDTTTARGRLSQIIRQEAAYENRDNFADKVSHPRVAI